MPDERAAGETTRREVLLKGAFVAPAILTLAAVPSFASAGSGGEEDGKDKKEKKEKDKDKGDD